MTIALIYFVLLQNQSQGHANLHHVDLTAYVEKPMDKQYVRVCKGLSVTHPTADQNVFKVQIVLRLKLV